MRSPFLLVAAWLFTASVGLAQNCPKQDPKGPDVSSSSRSLSGQLLFHSDIRQWFELKLDQPQCGQKSIQLVELKKSSALEIFRGCHVSSHGKLGDAGTTYFSLDIYQDVDRVVPDRPCTRKPPFPDYSGARPAKRIRNYQVSMVIDYGSGKPMSVHVSDDNRELHPWQAYANYDVNGSFTVQAYCAKGFVVDQVAGTPEIHPRHFDKPRTSDDYAVFDPEGAPEGVHNFNMSYTCIRAH